MSLTLKELFNKIFKILNRNIDIPKDLKEFKSDAWEDFRGDIYTIWDESYPKLNWKNTLPMYQIRI